MDGRSQTFKPKQSSAKCRPKPIEADFFEVAKDHSAIVSDDIRQTRTKCNSKSSEIVSTGDIVSAVGQIWESANRSLARLQPKRSAKPAYIDIQKENIVCQIGEKENIYHSILNENECARYNFKSCSLEQSSAEIAPLESCCMEFWRNRKDVYTLLTKSWNRKACVGVGISHDYRTRYGLMGQVSLCTLRQHVSTTHEYEKAIERYMMIDRSKASGSLSYHKTTPSNYVRNCSSDLSSDMKGTSSVNNQDVFKNGKMPIPSLSSDYLLQVDGDPQREVGAPVTFSSVPCANHFANSTSAGCAYEHHKDSFNGGDDGELPNNNRNTSQCHTLNIEVERQMEIPSVKTSKNHALAKQEHAFSGALAGTCVSLCLHPVDTIKTVIQSCKAEQKSLYFIGQSIISERGLTGLYRGIASNIATSAPISAIYTFSYETVKGLLLPYLPKEYHSFAHCTAGGCASIATSFIFTPSDRIKQQMQVSPRYQNWLTGLYRGIASNIATSAPISAIYTFSYETVKGLLLPYLPKEYHSFAHCTAGGCASIATSFIFTPSDRIKQQMQVSPRYQNCWNAFHRIVENGGLPSLYTGWGAVLCRNIPHSIIKFYTYESLKQHILSSDQPKTWQTLLCGGIAGSTAALFSTPFDVVKTRYQTQVPGSAKQYSGVFSAILQIRKTEGAMGLYRGLTPRLVMYMSQGALFFTSYEFFKDLFSLERPL